MTRYRINDTCGRYLRTTMREATEADVLDVLSLAAAYVGESASVEHWDDGRIVCGGLVARPISEDES